MGAIDGGALFGKALANEGVEKAFVLSGGHVMLIFYGMRGLRSSIRATSARPCMRRVPIPVPRERWPLW